MNFFVKSFLSIAVFFLLLSCGQSREKMLSSISAMDKELQSEHPADTVKVANLIGAYQAFANRFPKDTLAPEFMYKAAGLALSFNRTEQALTLYRTILTDYPTWTKAPECLFMQGFIFENNIKDLVKAKEIYNEFIARFPAHDLADDAVNAIKYLGKPLEEVIRDFEAKNAKGDTLLSGRE